MQVLACFACTTIGQEETIGKGRHEEKGSHAARDPSIGFRLLVSGMDASWHLLAHLTAAAMHLIDDHS